MKTWIFNFTGFIDNFIVPSSGIYEIKAWGGSGGGVVKSRGAFSQSFVFLEGGSLVHILVGESGGTGSSSNPRCGGGGGGTFVALGSHFSASSPLCVAGGGGSQMQTDTISNHAHGQSTRIGGDLSGRSQEEGHGGLSEYGSGGGGFYSNGIQGSNSYSIPGTSFLSGGFRVLPTTSYLTAYGGFGGGAANHGDCGVSQGGGGYTGGSSSGVNTNNGGGGGSFFVSYQSHEGQSIAGYDHMPNHHNSTMIQGNLGNGIVIIDLLQEFSTESSYKCNTNSGITIQLHQFISLILIFVTT